MTAHPGARAPNLALPEPARLLPRPRSAEHCCVPGPCPQHALYKVGGQRGYNLCGGGEGLRDLYKEGPLARAGRDDPLGCPVAAATYRT